MFFTVSRSQALRWVLIGSLPVVLLGVVSELMVAQYGPLPVVKSLRHFTFDSEHNMASWWSSALLGAGALLTLWMSTRSGGAAGCCMRLCSWPARSTSR